MKIDSPVCEVSKSQTEVYELVNTPEKYEQMMPEAVNSFICGEDFGMPWFAFTVGGMPEIKLVRSQAEPHSKVVFSTPIGAKISLTVMITPVSDQKCSVQISIDADVNPMLRMLVERPLRKFLDDMSAKIKELS